MLMLPSFLHVQVVSTHVLDDVVVSTGSHIAAYARLDFCACVTHARVRLVQQMVWC